MGRDTSVDVATR